MSLEESVLLTAKYIAMWALGITTIFIVISLLMLNHITKKYNGESLFATLKKIGLC